MEAAGSRHAQDLDFSAGEIAARIRRGELSSAQVVEACLARIEALDPIYHAYITVLDAEARQQARRADADVREGRDLGPLHGVPVTVKDAFLMRGTRTTVGSLLLGEYSPSDREDATCVERLRRAGAIVLGKVNVGSGMTRAYAEQTRMTPARNPWNPDRTPGGSSSGSAVSILLGMAHASVGTDLGGSIRIPAAFSGVVGLKPTYGRISQYGDVFGMAQALEHVGPLTKTVRDAALMLEVLAGSDPKDPTSADRPVPDAVAALAGGMPPGSRIGWVEGGGPAGAEPDVLARVKEGVGLLADAGAEIEPVTLPVFGRELWDEITLLDEWEAYDARADEARTYFAYVKANLKRKRQKVMDRLRGLMAEMRAAYARLFERFDLLALPTVPITAKPLGMWTIPWDGQERETMDLHLANTWMFNVTGHPAVSLPCGLSSEGLPVGLQLAGRHFQEDLLLRVAAAYEHSVGGFPKPPIP